MTEGPWDGSNLPPMDVKPLEPRPAGGGGGGGPAAVEPPHTPQLDARDKGTEGLLAHWPKDGVRPALGGWYL